MSGSSVAVVSRLNRYKRGIIVPASYMPGHPTSVRSPLVEALIPAVDDQLIMNSLSIPHLYDPRKRWIEDHHRIDEIFKTRKLFVCLPETVEVAQLLLRAIRLGYEGRDWHPRTRWTEVDAIEDSMRAAYLADEDEDALLVEGAGIFGTSGIGKSRTVRLALSLLPQAIEHIDYRSIRLDFVQLPYLLLECMTDGSEKTFCLDIFDAVDDILDTSYKRWYGRNGNASVNAMIGYVARMCRSHFVGGLVVDETQVLREMQRGNPDTFLNFLVRLSNRARVPIILVGTNKARSLIFSRVRTARRFSSLGEITWNQLDKENSWRPLMKAVWRHYYLRKDAPADDSPEFVALSNALYEETQGITHFAITTFLLAQILAIKSKEECLTVGTITSAAISLLRSARPLILALKAGDLRALERIDDIELPDLEEFADRAVGEYVAFVKASKAAEEGDDEASTASEENEAPEEGDDLSAANISTRTGPPVTAVSPPPSTADTSHPSPPVPRKPRRAPGVAQRDAEKPLPVPARKLARIRVEATKRNVGVYEALTNAGYIKAADEFIPEGASA